MAKFNFTSSVTSFPTTFAGPIITYEPYKVWAYIFNESGQVWQTTTNTFVTWNSTNFANYYTLTTSIDTGSHTFGGSTSAYPNGFGRYRQFTWPTAITTAGVYFVVLHAGTYTGTLYLGATATAPSITQNVLTLENGYTTNVPNSSTPSDLLEEHIVYWNGTSFAQPTTNVYTAEISLFLSSTNDQYTVTWLKNGIRVTTGISSPTIQVIKRSNGANLISSGVMTQLDSSGTYIYDEPTNRVSTDGYLVIVNATIESNTRSYSKLVGIYSGNVVW